MVEKIAAFPASSEDFGNAGVKGLIRTFSGFHPERTRQAGIFKALDRMGVPGKRMPQAGISHA
jgi:hypothetical protein